jgi:nicotinate dehydrogenase subunit B
MRAPVMSRRGFLQTSRSLVVTFSLGGLLSRGAAAQAPAAPAPSTGGVPGDTVDGFLAIAADGKVTVFSGKVDLGTGVRTAMTQIAAEELSVPLESVDVIQGDTLLTPDQGITFGSLSIQNGGMQIRQAAATAREALLAKGAERLGVPRSDVSAQGGRVLAVSGKQVSYAELLGGSKFELKLDPKAPLKDPATYTIVGKPVARLDIPAKVTGRFTYMQDFRRPGMVHARVVRPATLKSSLLSVDDSAARKVPGFIATVRKGSFLAVAARTEWGAIQAARALKATWSEWQGLPEQEKLWSHVRGTKVSKDEVLQSAGDTAGAVKAGKTLSATYDFAVHTHGSIGPSCAVAEVKGGKVTCWTASQATHLLQKQIAQMLGISERDVRCIYIEGSGCYGRNGHEDAAADAILVAKAIGKPVRVQWMRADEHGWDPKGPPTLFDFRASLGEQGLPVAWESEAFIPDRPAKISCPLVAAELAGLPTDLAHPGNIHQSLGIPYDVPNIRATAHWLAETPFRPSWIRTPGRMQNTFANESFIDECAAAAGADPLEYRRKLIAKDPRGLKLIDRLAKLAAWTPRASQSGGGAGEIATGRGVSYVKYELVRTYIGVVADVEVNRKTGAVRVKRFFVAHDCGQIINPDGLRNQIEGNVVQTVSRTLFEQVTFDRGKVTSVDWATYPILTFPDAPQVVIDLIDRPKEKPWGAGEPTAAVVPSAIANAIYDAVGARVRSVPFLPGKVLAAM